MKTFILLRSPKSPTLGWAIAGILTILAASTLPLSAFGGEYLTLNSFSGKPGTVLTVSGGGFTPSGSVELFVGESTLPTKTIIVDSSTNFTTSLVVPIDAAQGALSIVARDTITGARGTNSFYVNPFTPQITISEGGHTPFSAIVVRGTGFAPFENIRLELAGATGSTQADASGDFSNGDIVVPLVDSGLYHLQVTGTTSGVHVPDWLNYFWIDKFYPTVVPSAFYVMPGTKITFSGSGFSAGELISVYGEGSNVPLAQFTNCSCGSFEKGGPVVVPYSTQNKQITYEFRGLSSKATTRTTVAVGKYYPSISPGSYYTIPNTKVIISATGFAPYEKTLVSISKNDTKYEATVTTDSQGRSTTTLLVPFGTGSANVVAKGLASGEEAGIEIALASFFPQVTPSTYYVPNNSGVVFSGTGFAPNEEVTITSSSFGDTKVMTNEIGSFVTNIVNATDRSTARGYVLFKGSLSGASTSLTITLGS